MCVLCYGGYVRCYDYVRTACICFQLYTTRTFQVTNINNKKKIQRTPKKKGSKTL